MYRMGNALFLVQKVSDALSLLPYIVSKWRGLWGLDGRRAWIEDSLALRDRGLPAAVCIATMPQGGQPSNRILLDRGKIVVGTLCSVKKCLRLKFENFTVNMSFTESNGSTSRL